MLTLYLLLTLFPATALATPSNNVQITIVANNTDYGSVKGGGSVKEGANVTLTPDPKPGYYFIRWLENGTEVSTSFTYQFTAATNRTLVAEFAAIPVPQISAVCTKYNTITLNWTKSDPAIQYVVSFSTSAAGPYTRLAEVTALTYVHTGLETGKYYYYKVQAKVQQGNTTNQSADVAPIKAKPVLKKPATIKLKKVSSTSIKVYWGSVSGRTKYVLYRAASKTGSYAKVAETASAYYTVKNLKKGKTHYFKVRAYRLVGTTKVYGSYSSIVYLKL